MSAPGRGSTRSPSPAPITERSVDFYSPPRPQADRRQPGDRLRAVRNRRRRHALGPDRPRREDHRDDRHLSRMRRPRRARRAAGAQRHCRSSMARATSRGCGARRGCATPTATSSSSTRRAKRAVSRRGGSKTNRFHTTSTACVSLDPCLRGVHKATRCRGAAPSSSSSIIPQPLAGVDEAGCAPLAGPVVAARLHPQPRQIPARDRRFARTCRSKSARRSTPSWSNARPGASASPRSRRSTASTSIGRGCWR